MLACVASGGLMGQTGATGSLYPPPLRLLCLCCGAFQVAVEGVLQTGDSGLCRGVREGLICVEMYIVVSRPL